MNVFSSKDALQLPYVLDRTYEIRSCLKYSEQTATYLLREKSSGRPFLLKTATDPVCGELLVNEKNILDFIHQSADSHIASTFPTPVYLDVYEDTFFYIRTYIEGKTLEELCETNYKKPGLPALRALDYIISLTEILKFFHSLNPPLIHRDIKPQNVVVDEEGICHFIDLGISRFYHSSKKGDTLIMGTKLTAPPEQFGFQQTDMRSDLYSLGILLYYCITGQYEIDDKVLAELDPALQQIIRKITMFDPDKRYQSAEELLPVLLKARYPEVLPDKKKPNYQPLLLICIVLLFANLAFSAFLLQKWNTQESVSLSTESTAEHADFMSQIPQTDVASASQENTEYQFTEPLIEEAVRTQLNKPEGEITYSDLEKISTLCIFGLQHYTNDEDFLFKGEYPWCRDSDMETSALYKHKGTISSLEDILHMPNLTSLSLYNQQISDISLLKDTTIRELGLGYNPLTDLTPLTGNEAVTYLNVAALEIDTLEVIATLPNLSNLNISGTAISSLEGLENCPIQSLNLFQLFPSDMWRLKELPELDSLLLYNLSEEIIEYISGLPIRELIFYYSNNLSLNALESFPNLECLYYLGNHMQLLQADNPSLPNLKSLDIGEVTLTDFTALSSLKALETLFIYAADVQNYEGLDLLPNVSEIHCTEEQSLKIQEYYPENSYYLRF